MVAYGAHASWKVFLDRKSKHLSETALRVPLHNHYEYDWLAHKFTKVCVGVDSEQALMDVYNKALEAYILAALVIENDVPVAAAIGPNYEMVIDQITGALPLL